MTNYFLFLGDSDTGAFMKEEERGYDFFSFPHRGLSKWMKIRVCIRGWKGAKTLFGLATKPAFQMHYGDGVLFITRN